MNHELTTNAIIELYLAIRDRNIGSSASDWGGAHVVISGAPPPDSSPDEFYSPHRYVVTEYSRQLSWLFERLAKIFSELPDSAARIEFYGRLANSANLYIHTHVHPKVEELLLSVLYQAYSADREIEAGTFGTLPLASGSAILADKAGNGNSGENIGFDRINEFFSQLAKTPRA